MLWNSSKATASSFSKRRDRLTPLFATWYQTESSPSHQAAIEDAKTMTPIGLRISYDKKATRFFVMLVCTIMSFEIGKVDAFLSQPHQLTSSIPIAQIRNCNVDRPSALRATDEGNIIAVTDSNYRELFGAEKPLLLDACAVWCGPCKLIEPVLEQCAEDWKDLLVVGKFDVDDAAGENCKSRDLKVELILKGAMPQALPSLILVHNDKVLETWKGVISPTELQEMLERHVVKNQKTSLREDGASATKDFKTINNLDNKKSRPFRGIGFLNRF